MNTHTQPHTRFTTRKRAGLPRVTWHIFRILQDLRIAMEADYAWVYMDRVHPATVRAMLEKGLIVKSAGSELDRERYRISSKGLRTLETYTAAQFERERRPIKYTCPNCKKRQKKIYNSGNMARYCSECKYRLDKKRKQKTPR